MMIEFQTYQQSGHLNRSSGFLGSALVFQAYGLHSLLHWNHSEHSFFHLGHLDGIWNWGKKKRQAVSDGRFGSDTGRQTGGLFSCQSVL